VEKGKEAPMTKVCELPKFIAPKSLEDARIQIINYGNDLNSHAYILGKILVWAKARKKGEFIKWVNQSFWFKRATAHHYMTFSKMCDESNKMLDYSVFLTRLSWSGAMGKRKEEIIKNAPKYKPNSTEILQGKFQDVGHKIADCSIDLVCTDPPWGHQWLGQWGHLGEFAQRVLVPGGYLFTLCGKVFLPEVLSSLNKYLKYFGLFILRFDGGTAKLLGRPIKSQFNVILGFYKPPLKQSKYWVRDIFKVSPEKDFHEWQAQQQPISYLIKKFTQEGDSVLDPCGGSGTVSVVSERLLRRCTIIESEEKSIEVIKGRLALQQQGKEPYEEKAWTDLGTDKPRRKDV
jgi:hypothetical protein